MTVERFVSAWGRGLLRLVWVFAAALSPATPALSEPAEVEEHALPESMVDEPVEQEEFEHEHRNSLSLFLGGTREDDEGEVGTEFTFGLEYARRVAPRWSVVGVAERAVGEIAATVLLAQATYNPIGGLVFTTGPGMEIRDGRSEESEESEGEHSEGHSEEHHESESTGATVNVVWRIGVLYEFKIDRFILAPTIDIDFIARDAVLVFGANIGYEF